MANDPEFILRHSTDSSFRTVYANPRLTNQNVKHMLETLAHALESNDKGPLFVRVERQDSTPALLKLSPNLFHNIKLRATMRQMVHKETERIHTSRVIKATSKAEKKAF